MIDLLEPWADAWARVVLDRSVTFAIAALVFGAVWWPLRRRLSATAGAWFLTLPYLFLVFPLERLGPDVLASFSPRRAVEESLGLDPTPAAPALGDPTVRERVASTPESIPPIGAPGARPAVEEPLASAAPVSPADRSFPWRTVLFVGWLALGGTLLVVLLVRQVRGQRTLLRGGLAAPDWLQRLGTRLERVAGVGGPVRILVHDDLGSPATLGLRRPTIVLPKALLEALSPSQLRWVLLHELSHVARRDVIGASVQRVLRIAFFFHPLIWLTDRLLEEQRELACDERALDRCRPGPTRPYAEAFFEVIAHAHRARHAPVAALPLFDEKALLKRRLMRILNPEDRLRRSGTMTTLTLLTVATVAALTAARTPQDPPRADVGWRPPSPAVAQTSATLVERARRNVDGCLTWLLGQQAADGSFTVHDATGRTTCPELNDVAATAYATLALLGAADFGAREDLQRAVRRSAAWLQSQQDEELGLYGARQGLTFLLGHALATWTLARVQAVWPDAARRASLAKAHAFLQRARNPYKAWRYDYPPAGDNDTKITALMLLAYHALLEVEVAKRDPALLQETLGFLDEMTDPKTGRTGFTQRGQVAARLYQKAEDFPGEHSEELTALALNVRMRFGQPPRTSEIVRRGLELLRAKPPTWSPRRGTIDYSYWFYGSLALETVDDATREHWNAIFLEDVLPHATQDAEGLAHWPAIDAWSFAGGEVYATAVMTLALQAVLRD